MEEKSYILGEFLAVAQKMEEFVRGTTLEESVIFTKDNLDQFFFAPAMHIAYLEKHLVKFHKPLQEKGEDFLISESYRLYTKLNANSLGDFEPDFKTMVMGYEDYLGIKVSVEGLV